MDNILGAVFFVNYHYVNWVIVGSVNSFGRDHYCYSSSLAVFKDLRLVEYSGQLNIWSVIAEMSQNRGLLVLSSCSPHLGFQPVHDDL